MNAPLPQRSDGRDVGTSASTEPGLLLLLVCSEHRSTELLTAISANRKEQTQEKLNPKMYFEPRFCLQQNPLLPSSPGSPRGTEASAGTACTPDSHQLRPETVDDGTQGQAAAPGCGQVSDLNMLVTLGLLLAPG